MAIEFKYKVVELETSPSLNGISDVITKIKFTVTATDDETNNSAQEQSFIDVPSPNEDKFIKLGVIVEDDLIGWIKPTDEAANIELILEEKIKWKLK